AAGGDGSHGNAERPHAVREGRDRRPYGDCVRSVRRPAGSARAAGRSRGSAVPEYRSDAAGEEEVAGEGAVWIGPALSCEGRGRAVIHFPAAWRFWVNPAAQKRRGSFHWSGRGFRE